MAALITIILCHRTGTLLIMQLTAKEADCNHGIILYNLCCNRQVATVFSVTILTNEVFLMQEV